MRNRQLIGLLFEGEEVMNRPTWCPHDDCMPQLATLSCACGGKLPKPELHGDDNNIYRLCIRQSNESDEPFLFTLQVNNSDLFGLRRVFYALDGKHNPWNEEMANKAH